MDILHKGGLLITISVYMYWDACDVMNHEMEQLLVIPKR
jgi:hypothetical protein